MAIVAMVILAVLIWLLTSREPLWVDYVSVYTHMRDSAGLAPGAPVRLNGIPVGTIRDVSLTGSRDSARLVRIRMEVRKDFLPRIPVDSIAGITALNVLGSKEINISMGVSPQTVKEGGELPSEPSAEIQDLVRKGSGIFDAAQVIIGRLDKVVGEIEAGRGSVGKFLRDESFYNSLLATLNDVRGVTANISAGKGTIGKLLADESLYNQINGTMQRLDTMVADIQAGQGTAGKLLRDPALYDEARASIRELRKTLEDVNAGKGTAGKLLKDEAAYQQIQGILAKLDTTLDRVNSGQGTLGQLLVNPQLYESMTGATTELQSLFKDIRANPKKFLRIKLALF